MAAVREVTRENFSVRFNDASELEVAGIHVVLEEGRPYVFSYGSYGRSNVVFTFCKPRGGSIFFEQDIAAGLDPHPNQITWTPDNEDLYFYAHIDGESTTTGSAGVGNAPDITDVSQRSDNSVNLRWFPNQRPGEIILTIFTV